MGKIDLTYLEDITSGESEIMIEMIDLMLDETPKHIENLKKAYAEKDWNALGSEAHKLKPMFLYIGLTKLNEVSQKLESCGKNEENLDEIPELITQLDAGFEEVTGDLKAKKEELS